MKRVLVITTLYFWCAWVIAAPAPLAKPVKKKEISQPTALCKTWTLWWYGSPFKYEFKYDGTYVHHKVLESEYDYSGTWEVKEGVLIVRESCNGTPGIIYRMRPSDRGWRDASFESAHLRD